MTYREAMRWIMRAGVEIDGLTQGREARVVLRAEEVVVVAALDPTSPEDWESGFVSLVSRLIEEVDRGKGPLTTAWREEMPTAPS